jgi:integrase
VGLEGPHPGGAVMKKIFAKGLYARVNTDGKFSLQRVEIQRRNPVVVANTTAYFLRYVENGERKVEPLGKDIRMAFIAWQNHISDVERMKSGKSPIHRDELGEVDEQKRVTITDAVQRFIDENNDRLAKGKLNKDSVYAYNKAAEAFRDEVPVRFMDEITREVLLAHETYLHKTLQKRAFGKRETTITNRFRYLNIFLGRNGIKMTKDKRQIPGDPGLLSHDESPREPDHGVPQKYTDDEIKKLIAAATEDEKDLIYFRLMLGTRDEEGEVAEWSDIETRREGGRVIHQFHVQEKRHFNWTPKSKKARLIEMNDFLYNRLMERREKRVQTGDLIFPALRGGRDRHLIRRIQAAATRAGLKQRQQMQHLFRKNYASAMVGSSDIQTVQQQLGHADANTTMGYLSPDRAKARRASETAFTEIIPG